MTEDMLKVIVQTLDMLLTRLILVTSSNPPTSPQAQSNIYVDQQDKLREVFKRELKDASRT